MRLSLVLLFVSMSCLADNIVPSINDVPPLWGADDPTYREAICKAQEAFFIQSGITAQYGLAAGYISHNVANLSGKVENTAINAIDRYTPLNSKPVLFVVAVGYTAFVKKEVVRSFQSPLFSGVTNTLAVSESRQSLGFNIPF